MNTNMGTADRVIRALIVAVIAILYIAGIISGTMTIIFSVVAVIFLLTSMAGFCPLYAVLGIRTCPVKKKKL